MGQKEWCNILERNFQANLIREIKEKLPGIIVLKNDAKYVQGIPDLIVLYNDRWAALEVKKSSDAPYQPNQEFYLEIMDKMSFSATIYPENKEVVLYEMERALRSKRPTRASKSK